MKGIDKNCKSFIHRRIHGSCMPYNDAYNRYSFCNIHKFCSFLFHFFIFSKNFLFLYTILRSFYDNHNMGRSLWTVFLSDFDDFSKK